jgi:serine/threonine-protein kinase HipA
LKLLVTIDYANHRKTVGVLEMFNTRAAQNYQFTYANEWIATGFQIDPTLNLTSSIHHNQNMPGVFRDISPDRWGRLVQTRVKSCFVSDVDFMLSVSDYMRIGALRLSEASNPDLFLASHTNIPKLANIRELEQASCRVEKGLETQEDLQLLLGPGTSLGGAHPKASVMDGDKLCLAKFQSNTDTERVGAWEATMLDLDHVVGIPTAKHRLLGANSERPILLLERFDRTGAGRIHFASAMTLSGLHDHENFSYAELADVISSLSAQPLHDVFDLWCRMTFNAMTGNIDDHLRNHAFLRDY